MNNTSLKLSLVASLFLSSCAITPPHDKELHALATKTFGTDANVNVEWIPYAGPISSGLSSALGNTSDELAIASAMMKAKEQPVNLVVWSESSPKAASTILLALRYPGVQAGLQQLRLLFVGNQEDAAKIKSAVEATGAKFYFQTLDK